MSARNAYRFPRTRSIARSLFLQSVVLLTFVGLQSAEAVASDAVTWMNAVNVQVSGNSLTKTSPGATFDAGAISTNVIRNGYGFMEFTATETTTYRIAGLSYGDTDHNYTDVDYGIL